MSALRVGRYGGVQLLPDARRVLVKPFLPGEQLFPDGSSRIETILRRILAMSEHDVSATLAVTVDQFAGRHRNLETVLEAHFETVAGLVEIPRP